jgi:hypothetical protein
MMGDGKAKAEMRFDGNISAGVVVKHEAVTVRDIWLVEKKEVSLLGLAAHDPCLW